MGDLRPVGRQLTALRFRLVVFDLDGTLVDSERDIADADNATLESYGLGPLPGDEVGRMVGEGAAKLVVRIFQRAGVPRPERALERFLSLYSQRLTVHTRPYPGILEALQGLSGRASLAVLTNKPLEISRQILDGLGLGRFFPSDRVVGGDGPFARKPDPSGLQHLIALASATAETTLLVGDSVIDWKTARAAGTSVCLARYGFGFVGFPVGELTGAEALIDSPEAVVDLVLPPLRKGSS